MNAPSKFKEIRLTGNCFFRPIRNGGQLPPKAEFAFFDERGQRIEAPVLEIGEWIRWAVLILSSDWAKEFTPTQHIPIMLLDRNCLPERLFLMQQAIKEVKHGRKVLLESRRRYLLDRKPINLGDVSFIWEEKRKGFTFVDRGTDLGPAMSFEMAVDFSCFILRDELVREVLDGRYFVDWLPTHQADKVWIGHILDRRAEDDFPWEAEVEDYVMPSPPAAKGEIPLPAERAAPRPTEKPAASNPTDQLLWLVQEMADSIQRAGSFPAAVLPFLRAMSGLLEAAAGALKAAGAHPAAPIHPSAIAADRLAQLKEQAKQELEAAFCDEEARLRDRLAALTEEARQAVVQSQGQKKELDAAKEALTAERAALDAYKATLSSQKAEIEGLNTALSQELDEREERLKMREAEHGRRERLLSEKEAALQQLLSKQGADLISGAYKTMKGG